MILPLLSLCAALAAAAEFPIIDAHTHADFEGKPEKTSGIPGTLEEYLKEMKEAGVVAAVSHAPDLETPADLAKHKVIWCAGVGDSADEAKLEKGLKSGRFSCVKIYLGYSHHYASDPRYEPVYRLAEKYDVPVVFHTGDTYSAKAKLKYADPLTIDEVAVDHPKVRFVLAHCGNPWTKSAAELAYKNPNVTLDGSAFLIGDLKGMEAQDLDRYMVEPLSWIFGYVEDPTKLMFGSDWPLVRMADYAEAFKKAIPKQHWRAVFHDNAARVFKLKP